MKTGMKLTAVAAIFFTMITGGCGSSPSASGPDELDLAIRDASDYLNDNIPQGSMIVILNMQSDSTALSEYIIDELIANAVNDKIFKVVDRQQLDLIRTEQNFQLSGEVDDNVALSIGKFFGAQIIVSGRVRQLDDRYRMTIRALEVQTAQVQGQYNRNIAAGKTITALMKSGSGGGTQATPARTTGSGDSGTGTTGGTAAAAVPGGMTALNVNSVATWNTAVNKIRNGGNGQTYVINVTGNVSVPAPPDNENIFSSVTGITVTIQGDGILFLSVNDGSLLRIAAGQTVIVRNVTLRGHSGNNAAVVTIDNGGIFRMEGNASVMDNNGGGVYVGSNATFIMQNNVSVSGNTIRAFGGGGGGVYVDNGGTFNMQGGTISGNTAHGQGSAAGSGGGVYVAPRGTFTMENGAISGNNSSGGNGNPGGGAGVYVRGTFTMRGGTISGNTSNQSGGGVYVDHGTFTKTGGTISGNDVAFGDRNTAARQGHAIYIDSNPVRWRNTTAGPEDNTGGYGFWLND